MARLARARDEKNAAAETAKNREFQEQSPVTVPGTTPPTESQRLGLAVVRAIDEMTNGDFEYTILPRVVERRVAAAAAKAKLDPHEVRRRLVAIARQARASPPGSHAPIDTVVDGVYADLRDISTQSLGDPRTLAEKLRQHGLSHLTPDELDRFSEAWTALLTDNEEPLKAAIRMHLIENADAFSVAPEPRTGGFWEFLSKARKKKGVSLDPGTLAEYLPLWQTPAGQTALGRYWNQGEYFETPRLLEKARELKARGSNAVYHDLFSNASEAENLTWDQVQALRYVDPRFEEHYQHYAAVRALGPPARFDSGLSLRQLLIEERTAIDDGYLTLMMKKLGPNDQVLLIEKLEPWLTASQRSKIRAHWDILGKLHGIAKEEEDDFWPTRASKWLVKNRFYTCVAAGMVCTFVGADLSEFAINALNASPILHPMAVFGGFFGGINAAGRALNALKRSPLHGVPGLGRAFDYRNQFRVTGMYQSLRKLLEEFPELDLPISAQHTAVSLAEAFDRMPSKAERQRALLYQIRAKMGFDGRISNWFYSLETLRAKYLAGIAEIRDPTERVDALMATPGFPKIAFFLPWIQDHAMIPDGELLRVVEAIRTHPDLLRKDEIAQIRSGLKARASTNPELGKALYQLPWKVDWNLAEIRFRNQDELVEILDQLEASGASPSVRRLGLAAIAERLGRQTRSPEQLAPAVAAIRESGRLQGMSRSDMAQVRKIFLETIQARPEFDRLDEAVKPAKLLFF